jgi:crossover junction endodeoxyribonuclease RuvC
MRILGIDCGTERTGYGIIETDGRRHRLVIAGVIQPKGHLPLDLRLREIAAGLRGIIEQHRPEAVAVEEVFHSVNPKSALRLAHARGVALLAIGEAELPWSEYSALEVKKSVVGFGRAEKQQVQMMVQALLGLTSPVESEDAADAIAVAVCHATNGAFTKGRTA